MSIPHDPTTITVTRPSKWVGIVSITGTILIGVFAFWLSYAGLKDLAARSGVVIPWVWPLITDGLIVVATIAAVALARKPGAWYPWLLLIGGAVLSVAGNAIHAMLATGLQVPPVMAAVVASVPPVVLVASTHLTVLLTRPDPGHRPDEPTTPDGTESVVGDGGVTVASPTPRDGGQTAHTPANRHRPGARVGEQPSRGHPVHLRLPHRPRRAGPSRAGHRRRRHRRARRRRRQTRPRPRRQPRHRLRTRLTRLDVADSRCPRCLRCQPPPAPPRQPHPNPSHPAYCRRNPRKPAPIAATSAHRLNHFRPSSTLSFQDHASGSTPGAPPAAGDARAPPRWREARG